MKRLFPPALALAVLLLASCANGNYNKALTLMENGDFAEAKAILDKNPEYQDSADLLELCRIEMDYAEAVRLLDDGEIEEALEAFYLLGSFRDSKDKATLCVKYIRYEEAVYLIGDMQWEEAGAVFEQLGKFLNSEANALRCRAEATLDEVEEILLLISTVVSDDIEGSDGGEGGEGGEGGYSVYSEASILYSQAIELLDDIADSFPTRDRAAQLHLDCVYDRAVVNLRYRSVKSGDNRDFAEIAEQFLSCGDYRGADKIAEILIALAERDTQKFTDAMLDSEDEITSCANLHELVERFLEWNLSLDDSLAILRLHSHSNHSSDGGAFTEVEPEFVWSVGIDDADEEIYERCSETDAGKLLVLVRVNKPDNERYIIPLSVMSALQADLQPSSMEDIGYILFIDYDFVNDGTYSNGTRGIREFAEITLYTSHEREVVQSWNRVMGNRSPESFNYSGEPPLYVSGGSPDLDAVRANCNEAVVFLAEG